MYFLLSIFIALVLLISWILLSRMTITINTKLLYAEIKWATIGSVRISGQDEKWMISFRTLFYTKTMLLRDLGKSRKAAKKKKEKKEKKKAAAFPGRKKINTAFRMLKTFSVREWKIGIDTEDNTINGCLHSLYAIPALRDHVEINFMGNNYLVMKITNRGLFILLAFLNLEFFKP